MSSDHAPDVTEMNADMIEREMAKSLPALRRREIAQGITVIGPHRDDLDVFLNGNPAQSYASRGQSRTIALSLKLAEAVFVREVTGRSPVLALDDILSELDPRRRELVLESATKHQQVLLTATEPGIVPDAYVKEAVVFKVTNGVVTSEDSVESDA